MTTTITPAAVRTASPRLLLSSQLIFNIGFYAVIPFLAVSLREDFAMGAMAVGIVLVPAPSPSRVCSWPAAPSRTCGGRAMR